YHSRFSKEESKKALLRLYGLLSETVDVDEILNLIKTVIKILKKPEIYQDLKVYKTHNNNSALDTLCVFWNENVNLTLGGAWSTNGLRLIDTYHNNHSNAMYYTCRTNHLTNFAILMEISEYRISPEDEFALGIITYVGCSISLLCLLVTIITLPFIRLREIHFKIHLNLCIALAAAQIIILSGLAAVQNKCIEKATEQRRAFDIQYANDVPTRDRLAVETKRVKSFCGNGWDIYITMLMFVNMKYRYCFAKCTAVDAFSERSSSLE
ncbi:hypothetical protein QZH41_012902, partial [Actinostola sp. cb2023]